jgi:uncharacterized protein (TIGR00369 family)
MSATVTGTERDPRLDLPVPIRPADPSRLAWCGLRIKASRSAAGQLRFAVAFESRHTSYPGIVHGGVISGLMDEVMAAAAATEAAALCFCSRLSVRYLEPARLGTSHTATAWVDRQQENVVFVRCDLTGDDGTVLAMAEGTYQRIKPAHGRALLGEQPSLSNYYGKEAIDVHGNS